MVKPPPSPSMGHTSRASPLTVLAVMVTEPASKTHWTGLFCFSEMTTETRSMDVIRDFVPAVMEMGLLRGMADL